MLDTLVSVTGALKAPFYIMGEKTGMIYPNYGWENIKLRYCKNFEIGIEIIEKFPLFSSINSIEQRTRQAVKLCRKFFSDIVIEPDILVTEGRVKTSQGIQTGYNISFTEKRDYSKAVLLDVIWDRHKRSCHILANVFNHFIDGIPALFLISAVAHHLVRGKDSILLSMARTPASDYQETINRFPGQPDKSGWARLLCRDEKTLWPTGAPVDVSSSAIKALQEKIKNDTGLRPSMSSVELGVLSMETGMDYATEYVARSGASGRGAFDLDSGYRGLGMVQTQGYASMKKISAEKQYIELCKQLSYATKQLPLEKKGKGKSSIFYRRYGRTRSAIVDFFEKRVSFKNVMTIAGTQCIASNLNGVNILMTPLGGDITPENIHYIFTASHGEFAPHIRSAREERGLPLYATELSLACSPLMQRSDEKKIIYKSVKVSPEKAREIMRSWGISTAALDENEVLVKFFNELYRPTAPTRGRVEKAAARLLEAGRTCL